MIARALVDGDIRLCHFEDHAPADPSVRAVMAQIKTGAHPDMPANSENQFGSEVSIVLTDGSELTRRIDHQLGRGPDDPMSGHELRQKFGDCAGRVLSPLQVDLLFEKLRSLHSLHQISELSDIIHGDHRMQESAAE